MMMDGEWITLFRFFLSKFLFFLLIVDLNSDRDIVGKIAFNTCRMPSPGDDMRHPGEDGT